MLFSPLIGGILGYRSARIWTNTPTKDHKFNYLFFRDERLKRTHTQVVKENKKLMNRFFAQKNKINSLKSSPDNSALVHSFSINF